jgi:hypothetical protein
MFAAGEHGRNHAKYLINLLKSGVEHVIGKQRKVVAVRKDN